MMTVIKIGGSLIASGPVENMLGDIARLLTTESEKIVLVHGGGKIITEYSERLGVKPTFIFSPEGIRSRYTDKETADIYNMVMGKINSQLVLGLAIKGIRAFGLSGIDGWTIRAERKKRLLIIDEKGRKRAIEGGYTGKVKEVNTGALSALISAGYLPVISPVAMGFEGEALNIDGDRTAAAIAAALKADRLVIFTDVDGLLMDGKLVEHMDRGEAKETLRKVGPGMDKKVMACIEALEGGVRESVISSGLVQHPLENALEGQHRTVIV